MDASHFAGAFYELPSANPDLAIKVGEMDGGQPFLYHWHDAVELLYGLQGDTSVGIMGRAYALGEGDMIVIGSGESHCVFPSDHQARRLAILFEPALLFSENRLPGYRDCFAQVGKHSRAWPAEARRQMKGCIAAIYEEYSQQKAGWELQVCSLLFSAAAMAVRSLPKAEGRPREGGSGLLRQVLAYLSAEYRNEVTLASCARALGFHPAYLSHQFKAQMGISFHRYLVNLRLIKAEALLGSPGLPIAQAAALAGFANEKTFYRAFREKHGISPGQYRRKLPAL